MLDTFITELLRIIVIMSAGFNFFILVFFYERDGGSRRRVLYSVAALLIAIGQLYLCASTFKGADAEWPIVASQIGFTIVIVASLGSVKRAASFLIDHCGGCNGFRKSD